MVEVRCRKIKCAWVGFHEITIIHCAMNKESDVDRGCMGLEWNHIRNFRITATSTKKRNCSRTQLMRHEKSPRDGVRLPCSGGKSGRQGEVWRSSAKSGTFSWTLRKLIYPSASLKANRKLCSASTKTFHKLMLQPPKNEDKTVWLRPLALRQGLATEGVWDSS